MMASLLDGRTKNLETGLPPADKERVWAAIVDSLVDIHVEDYRAEEARKLAVAGGPPVPAPIAVLVEVDEENVFSNLVRASQQPVTAAVEAPGYGEFLEEARLTVLREVKHYRAAPGIVALSVKDLGDPLQWWRDNAALYPTMVRLARRILCIPATSAPSERLFSTAGLTVTDKRANLDSERVSELVFLHDSLDYYEYLVERNNKRKRAAEVLKGDDGGGKKKAKSTNRKK
jgi:hypothetical protein